jgi:hypothetical protein
MMFLDQPVALIIAFSCSFVGLVIALCNIYKHTTSYTQPDKQRAIIRILGIVPVYAVGSFFSMVFHEDALYFDTIRDIYEAWVINSFLNLILAYGGGENEICVKMAMDPGSIKHPYPLCCLPPIQLGSQFMRSCKKGCLQFVVVKPIFAVMSLIMYGLDKFDEPWYQFLLQSVYNISYTVALYSLLLFYLATHNLLHEISPVFKFFAVKIVIFATYYQSLAVAAVPGVPHELSQRWNNFILCCEMSLFALLHFMAFPAKEFSQGAMVTSFYSAFADAVNIQDVGRDLGTNFNSRYSNYASAIGGNAVSPAIALKSRVKSVKMSKISTSNVNNKVESVPVDNADEDIEFELSEDEFQQGMENRSSFSGKTNRKIGNGATIVNVNDNHHHTNISDTIGSKATNSDDRLEDIDLGITKSAPLEKFDEI